MKRNIYKVYNIGLYSLFIDTMAKLTEEYKVDAVFLKESWKPLTYLDIQKLSGKKSKGFIYKALRHLIDSKTIIPERIGKRNIIYHPNLSLASVQSYLGYLHEYASWTNKQIPLQIIENLRAKMPTPFFTLIVTGSYAKGKQHKKSDLDVVILCEDSFSPQKITAELGHISDTSIPSVHLYSFTKKQFLEMLLSEKQNYGKEIAKNCLIFYGGAAYYSILHEAIKYGFKG